jgi:hypothetical protein
VGGDQVHPDKTFLVAGIAATWILHVVGVTAGATMLTFDWTRKTKRADATVPAL